jgi:hypothetical protein
VGNHFGGSGVLLQDQDAEVGAAKLGRVVATSAVLITLPGWAEARSATTEGGIPSRASSVASLVANSSSADVAHVVCEKDVVRVENPDVRAQRDGVHFLIENPGDAWGVDLHHDSWAYGTAEEFELKDEATQDASAMGPGSVTVACLPTSQSSYYDPGVPTAMLVTIDPGGLYVPWDLACGFGKQFRMKIAASEDEDPAPVFRRVPGVRDRPTSSGSRTTLSRRNTGR